MKAEMDRRGFAHKYPWAKKHSKDPDAVNHAIVNEDIPALWRRLFDEEWSPVQVKTVKGYNFGFGHCHRNCADELHVVKSASP